MRLVSLKLKNYRRFKDITVEFADGLTGICGLNGVGKSTLIECIAWVLYGNVAARSEKEGIKRTGAPVNSSVEAVLEIEISGIIYQITRILKGSSQASDASIISGGKIIAASARGVDKEINHLLGMDYTSFYTSFFAKQKELNALSDLQPNRRREIIMRLLRIDDIDKAIEKVRKTIKEGKIEAEIMDRSQKKELELEVEKTVIENKIKKINPSAVQSDDKCRALEVKLEELKIKFNKEREINDIYNGLTNKRTEIKARISGISKRINEITEEIGEITKISEDLGKIEIEYNEYLKKEKEYNKMVASCEEREREIKKRLAALDKETLLLDQKEQLIQPGKPCPTCGQKIVDEKNIREHFKNEKDKIINERNNLNEELLIIQPRKWEIKPEPLKTEITHIDIGELIKLPETLKSLKPSFERYPFLKSKFDRKSILEATLSKAEKELDDYVAKQDEIEKQLNKLLYDKENYNKLENEYDDIRSQLNLAFKTKNDLNLELQSLKTSLKAKIDEIDLFKKTKEEIDRIKKEIERKNRLADLLVEYRIYLIARIRPQLSESAGKMFCSLTNAKYSDIELDENYDMFIFDDGAKYPLTRFSGGEIDLANLCLRLSISQLISASSGSEGGFIILDEIFGSQDAIRKASIIEALNQLSNQFRQIMLITHIEDIKDTLENIIEVIEDEDGVSRIRQ